MNKLLFAELLLLLIFPVGAQAAPSLPRLHVDGNHLASPDGKPVTLHGVSLCSVEWQNAPQGIDDAAGPNTQWHATVIRLPVQVVEWNRTGPDAHIKNYIDPAVAACDRDNVYCVIDWHDIADWNDPKAVSRMEDFWRRIAPRYADDPHILYELFNEPKDPAEMTDANWLAYKKAADGWIAHIRAKAQYTVILAGSPHWSQMPAFAAQAPLADPNVAYVMHLYPNWPVEAWAQLFGDASAKLPIFISEWGWSTKEEAKKVEFYGTAQSFGEPLRTYLAARPQINWTAWSYDKACGPAMTGPDHDMGDFVRGWLNDLHKGATL